VTHNDCRRQLLLVFKQVKTFQAPPNLTSPQTPGLDPPLEVHQKVQNIFPMLLMQRGGFNCM